jgi:hypothetical protein
MRYPNRLAHLVIAAVVLIPFSDALNSCFKTDNYNAVRGQPFVVTWPDDQSEYDLALETAAFDFIGYIAS